MSYDESSCSDSDNGHEEDMEALRKACFLTGVDYDDTFESEDEDIESLRSLQQRFSVNTSDIDTEKGRISMKPLQTIIPSSLSDQNDDYGDDFETLRAIQRRFSQYEDSMNICMESSSQRSEQVGATNKIDLGKESNPNFFLKSINNRRGFPDCVDGRTTNQNSDVSSNITIDTPCANVSEAHEPCSELVPVTDGSFPRSAQAFVEAIKKNRTCQKLIRNKLAQIEVRMEENRKLRERVKILKDFRTACRKRTGRALSQKKDPRIQLISIPKQRANASKDKNTHPIYQGPAENPHVAHYRNEVSKYPFSLSREPWSKEEKEKLLKGIRQQFQEMLTRNLLSGNEDSCYRVNMIKKIKNKKITGEELKSFVELDKVNWERVASIYLIGRSAPECESRWRNCEDPLINHEKWNSTEDKKLLHIVSNRGISNWIEIVMELKSNRTPFQCLSRFQRSLNASIIKNEWTPPEDEELRKAVAEYGETNWQLVASTLEGRTGTQCSNRWKKSLNPLRKRVGKWGPDEDKRLIIAAKLFGAKKYNKIAKFVPGRTQSQCRERWVNCLDPSLNMDEWTEYEDSMLLKAIREHNYCWSRIAASIPPRTDSQCRRRWKMLCPDQVYPLQIARKLKRAALISNFVDREGERPDITVNDFVTPLLIESDPKAYENCNTVNKTDKRTVLKYRSRRSRKVTHTKKVFKLTDEDDVAESNGHADITITTFDGDNLDTEKQATGKCKLNERIVVKKRSRRGRKVTHTEKVFNLIDEDDVAENNGHADITITAFDGDNLDTKKQAIGKCNLNERSIPKIRSRRARQVTHTEKVLRIINEDDVDTQAGFSDRTSVEKSKPLDGCEIERKVTGKRKRNQREKKSMIDCGFDDDKRSSIEKRGEAELKVYIRRRYRKDYPNPKRCSSINIKSIGEEDELEDEETLGCFFIKLKRRKLMDA